MYEKILSTVLLNVGVQKGNAYVHQASTVEYESVKPAPPKQLTVMASVF